MNAPKKVHSLQVTTPILSVRFFCTDAGNEPVRDFLKTQTMEDRRAIGTDIKTVQFGWPLGMPLVRKADTQGRSGHRPGQTAETEEGDIMNKYLGSSLDDLLQADGLQEEVTAAALKRVFAWQLEQAMKARQINKSEMAKRMHTSRTVVNRLLDADDTSVTLATLARASVAVGVPLKIEMA